MKRLLIVIRAREGHEREVIFNERATIADLQGGPRSPAVGVQDIVRVELLDDEPKEGVLR